MATIFYIDSENVGDSWIELLDHETKSECLFKVFYTSHSPRIAYPQVIQLMNANNKLEFIECYEGNNGLDFQLVSYLGYELHADNTNEMIIVSNDTGFDAVVLFWKGRGMNVKRVSNSNNPSSHSIEKQLPVSDEVKVTNNSPVEVKEMMGGISRNEIYTIINCIGKKELSFIHLVLVHFYGNKNGEKLYKILKAEEFVAPSVQWKKETKLKKLIELMIKYSALPNNSYPETFLDFMINNVVDDKSAMKKKLSKAFGDGGTKFHKEFKPYYKMLVKIKKK